MKTKFTLALIKRTPVLLLLLSAINYQRSAQAQGTAFTYQGRLNDGTNPANGFYDFQFTLYDDASDPLSGVSITKSASEYSLF